LRENVLLAFACGRFSRMIQMVHQSAFPPILGFEWWRRQILRTAAIKLTNPFQAAQQIRDLTAENTPVRVEFIQNNEAQLLKELDHFV